MTNKRKKQCGDRISSYLMQCKKAYQANSVNDYTNFKVGRRILREMVRRMIMILYNLIGILYAC